MGTDEPYEGGESPKGFWTRVREKVFNIDSSDAPATAEADGSHPRSALRSSPAVQVAVRLNATDFTDARIAADGLKAVQQQIVNLEHAQAQLAERIVDFLSGVTYALDGSVHRVGEKVYLFAPANFQVERDEGSEQADVQG